MKEISFCSRFINYQPTSLERSYRHELLTEHDLGIAVDLILPDAYVHVIIIFNCSSLVLENL